MNELSLFSGAGGGLLASRLLGWRTVGYVEFDSYCQAVIKARQADGLLDVAPIFGNIREFVLRGWAREYRGIADVVSGGFPCQPFSVAGKRLGIDDHRNMWPYFEQVVRLVRPRYVFAENVPGLLSWDGGSYFGHIVGSLAALGYGVRWTVLGADDVGAPHRRKRLWILAYSLGAGVHIEQGRIGQQRPEGFQQEWTREADLVRDGPSRDVADANEQGPQGRGRALLPERASECAAGQGCSWWSLDPADIPDAEDPVRRGADREDDSGRRDSKTGRQDQQHAGAEHGPVESRVCGASDGMALDVD